MYNGTSNKQPNSNYFFEKKLMMEPCFFAVDFFAGGEGCFATGFVSGFGTDFTISSFGMSSSS